MKYYHAYWLTKTSLFKLSQKSNFIRMKTNKSGLRNCFQVYFPAVFRLQNQDEPQLSASRSDVQQKIIIQAKNLTAESHDQQTWFLW